MFQPYKDYAPGSKDVKEANERYVDFIMSIIDGNSAIAVTQDSYHSLNASQRIDLCMLVINSIVEVSKFLDEPLCKLELNPLGRILLSKGVASGRLLPDTDTDKLSDTLFERLEEVIIATTGLTLYDVAQDVDDFKNGNL